MERKIVEYCLVIDTREEDLEETVNKKVREWRTPIWGVSVVQNKKWISYYMYTQAMVKYE